MLIGSLVFGPIADAIGRKRVLIVSVFIFGAGTLASAYTHSIESLTVLRFITGIGLGGAMPTCITLSSEYSPARRRMIMVTLSWSGFTAGLALWHACRSNYSALWLAWRIDTRRYRAIAHAPSARLADARVGALHGIKS
uniref:Major facilitator superfamily (MFS) profile domain-containing protein n=1 Tax=Ectopseudomonas oleovorans TaxID=301 RepID=A0A653BD00_ECTOL